MSEKSRKNHFSLEESCGKEIHLALLGPRVPKLTWHQSAVFPQPLVDVL
jgi:hypothetical protein